MDRRSRRSTRDRSPRIGRWAPRTFGPGLFPLTSAPAAPSPHRRTAGPADSPVHQIVRFLPTPRSSPPPSARPTAPPEPSTTLSGPLVPLLLASAMTRRAQANRTSRPPGGDVRRAPPTSRPWGTSQAGPGWPPSTEALAQRWNSARDDRIGTTPIEGVRVKLRSRAKHGSLIGHFDPSESSTAELSDRPSTSSPRQAVGVASLGDGAVQSSPRFCSSAGWAAGRL